MKLHEIMNCDMVPAASTGDFLNDNVANLELYFRLLKDGEQSGFCPILFRKEGEFYVYTLRYGTNDDLTKEEYTKARERLLDVGTDGCFSVWQGKALYNFCLQYTANTEEEFSDRVNKLELIPETDSYIDRFTNKKEQALTGIFDENEVEMYTRWEHSFDEYCFALIPTVNPWEILSWIPMGKINFSVTPEYNIALSKMLYERYGAKLMLIGYDTLKYYVEEPLYDKKEVENLIKTLRIFAPDEYPNYEVSAETIVGSHIWPLWWD